MFEIARAFYYVLSGAYILLTLSYFQVVRRSWARANRRYLTLCILGLFYALTACLGTYGFSSIRHSVVLVLFASCLGFASDFVFLRIADELLGGRKTLRIGAPFLMLPVLIFGLAAILVSEDGSSWTVVPSEFGYGNIFFARTLPWREISAPAQLTLGIFSTLLLALRVYTLAAFWKHPRFGGVWAAAMGMGLLFSLNDLTAGLGWNDWMFPVACAAHILVVILFQGNLIRTGGMALERLPDTIFQLSQLKAKQLSQSRVRHDLKLISRKLALTDSLSDTFKLMASSIDSLLKNSAEPSTKDWHCIRHIVDAGYRIIADQAVPNEIQFYNDVAHDLRVYVNFSDILLVFVNLIQNAIDAHRCGASENLRWIKVRGEADLRGVTLTFEDNGPGLAPVVRDRIFRIPVTSKTHGEGLGLISVKETLMVNRAFIACLPQTEGCRFQISFLNPEAV